MGISSEPSGKEEGEGNERGESIGSSIVGSSEVGMRT